MIKNADVPYEDEKYSYIVFAKEKVDNEGVRILRHPQIAKGRIDLEICGKNENKKIRITKKNKELFKIYFTKIIKSLIVHSEVENIKQ